MINFKKKKKKGLKSHFKISYKLNDLNLIAKLIMLLNQILFNLGIAAIAEVILMRTCEEQNSILRCRITFILKAC